jgi:ribosome-associated toxin RatA of RatAB toxin-antitoxin module
MINKRYNEFLPSMQGAEVLMGQAEEVSKEIDVLKSCIETEVSVMNLFMSHWHLLVFLGGVTELTQLAETYY